MVFGRRLVFRATGIDCVYLSDVIDLLHSLMYIPFWHLYDICQETTWLENEGGCASDCTRYGGSPRGRFWSKPCFISE
jgi:hypothetical protein